jgi:hypothetical protein
MIFCRLTQLKASETDAAVIFRQELATLPAKEKGLVQLEHNPHIQAYFSQNLCLIDKLELYKP